MNAATLDNRDTREAPAGHDAGRRLRPALRRRGFIGIDIGLHWTKLAQAEWASGEPHVRALDVFETQATESPRGFELPDDFGRRLAWRLNAGEFKGNEAACLLPANVYEHHQVSLAEADRFGSPAELCLRIAEQLPASWHRAPFDFRTLPGELLGDPKSSGRADASMVATHLIETVAEQLFQAGVDVQHIDTPGEAAARSVELDDDVAPLDCLAVVDWGYEETSLTVVNAGAPVFFRRLRDVGYAEILLNVSRGLKIGTREAGALLQSYGLEQPPLANEIASRIASPHRRLQEELDRTLAYFRRKHLRLSPAGLLLTGDGASMRGGHLLWNNSLELTPRTWTADRLFRARPPRFRPSVFARAFSLSTLAFSS